MKNTTKTDIFTEIQVGELHLLHDESSVSWLYSGPSKKWRKLKTIDLHLKKCFFHPNKLKSTKQLENLILKEVKWL